jgi:low affinity Fe/Cu permease
VINTGATIVTFLMVFLIQNTQNRDALAVHLKLDELIRAMESAADAIMDAEEESDAELAELKRYYQKLADDQEQIKAKIAEALRIKASGAAPLSS